MEPALKQRLIGAVVISALAIVFLPKLIVGHDKDNPAADVSLQIPGAPDRNFETRELPLTAPGTTPMGGVVGMNTSVPPPPGTQPSAAPASTDANSAPLAIDPNAPAVTTPAVPGPGVAAATIANGATALPPALPTTQNVLPATPASGPVAIPSAPPVSTSSSTVLPATAVSPVAQPGAPIPAAHAGGNYVVSAGIYSNAANAQSLVASLKAAQLPAYAETMNVNGKSRTRVRVGPYPQRGDAEAARLRAQQVRADMTASVTALDGAAGAPATPPATPIAIKPAPSNAPIASTIIASTPVTPATAAANSVAGKPTATASNSVAGKPATAAPVPQAALSPAATGRGYVVQVSAFHSEDDALALRNRLRAAGFTAFSERVQADQGTLFRVRIGPVADRQAAEQLRASLSQKTSLSGLVVAFP